MSAMRSREIARIASGIRLMRGSQREEKTASKSEGHCPPPARPLQGADADRKVRKCICLRMARKPPYYCEKGERMDPNEFDEHLSRISTLWPRLREAHQAETGQREAAQEEILRV